MQAQIRLAQSGHSYHYSQLTTVHALMQQIRKDFKIEMQDQKIIMKSGEILKSTMSFDSIQELMKKTIPTNNTTAFNPTSLKQNELMKQIECLYIYNQKQLLKPIEQKYFNEEFYLKTLKEKCKEMSSLAENPYQFKQFTEKVQQKNILSFIEAINKKVKTPFQNITLRHSKLYDSLNQRNYSKLQISSLLDLIQNQDKARKLLIRNIEYLFDRKTKKKLASLREKVARETDKENEAGLKENSSFFTSNQKGNQSYCSEGLTELTKTFSEIESRCTKFYQTLKQRKKEVIKERFLQEQKITFRIDKKVTSISKEYEQSVRFIKEYFDQFFEQVIKVNTGLTKPANSKDTNSPKDLYKNLLAIHQKILTFQKRIDQTIKEFTQMYLQLSRIHLKGQAQNIKVVFEIYVELIKAYEDLDMEMRRFEKEFNGYREGKERGGVKVSEFSNAGINMPLVKKSNVKSPKKDKQDRPKNEKAQKSQKSQKSQNSQLSISKDLNESLIPKINSPIKNKITKNSLKGFNDQITQKTFESAIKENKELARRLGFNGRLEALTKYCSNLCEKEQQMRRNFRNSKEFEENRIDLLGVYNVPSLQIDYNETTDMQLTHMYKKWVKQNSLTNDLSFQEINWQHEIVQTANSVNRTLTNYLASKSNATQRQRSLQKILSILSETFYKMMKNKLEKETDKIYSIAREKVLSENRQIVSDLVRSNEEMMGRIREFQEAGRNLKIEIGNHSLEHMDMKTKDLQSQNDTLKQQVKNLQEKLFIYQQEFNQTTQKLIQSYEQSHSQQVTKLTNQIKKQQQVNFSLSKDIKDSKSQLEMAKTNLMKQFQNIENLFKEIDQLTGVKEFYEREMQEMKGLLADKEVAIIRLEKQLESLREERSGEKEKHIEERKSSAQYDSQSVNINVQDFPGNDHQCEYKEEALTLRQANEQLQQQVQSLDRQLKEILFKETSDQQIQTVIQDAEENALSDRIKKADKFTCGIDQNSRHDNQQTSKILPNDHKALIYDHEASLQIATKQISLPNNQNNVGNFMQSNTSNNPNDHFTQIDPSHHGVMSQYYVSSQMMSHQWMTAFGGITKCPPIVIGPSIEQGMCHIFLPFSSDIYIGVTSTEDSTSSKYTNYQQYLNNQHSTNHNREPVHVLDLKEYNARTSEMLRECSLVLVVKVDRKEEVSGGNKVMVSGRVCFALGFEDDDMGVKNYSGFLDQ